MDVALFELHHYKTIAILYAVNFALGFIANSFVLVVFFASPSLRKQSGNYLLISMTFCDWFMATFASSVGIYANSKFWWTLHPAYCDYFGFVSSWGGLASMIHITALAGEKFFTLKFAVSEEISKAKMLLVVASVWLFAFLWALFPLVGWSAYAPEPGYAGCSIEWYSQKASDKAYIVCLFIFFFFIPICFVSFCFGTIYIEVKKLATNAIQRWGVSTIPTQQTLKAKAKTIRMSLIMVLAFLFAWTPYAVVALYSSFFSNDISPTASTIPSMFAKSSNFYNPIIYFFMYTKFRVAAKKLISKRSSAISPGSGSDSTAQSQNGSFLTSFPRPRQFLDRLSARNLRSSSLEKSSSVESKKESDGVQVIRKLDFATVEERCL